MAAVSGVLPAAGGGAKPSKAVASILVREEHRVVLMSSPSADAVEPKLRKVVAEGDFTVSECSPNGKLLVLAEDDAGVSIVSLGGEDCKTLCTLDHKEVKKAGFSPKGTYVCTMHRKIDGRPNVMVWRVADGTKLCEFHEREAPQRAWPVVHWTHDESSFALRRENAIRFYSAAAPNMDKPDLSGRLDGVTAISVAPAPAGAPAPIPSLRSKESDALPASEPSLASASPEGEAAPVTTTLAAFVPRRKGQPARMLVYRSSDISSSKAAVVSKALMVDNAEFEWAPDGAAVLVTASTETSDKSYYGESFLYLASSCGRLADAIVMSKPGPVHCVAWSPYCRPSDGARDFVVIGGNSPPSGTLYRYLPGTDRRSPSAKAVFDFGEGPRNTAIFSPRGRFVALGGFRNMSGRVEVWDAQRMKKLGDTRMADTIDFSWTPCGRYIVSGTTHPRMRVDNKVRVFHHRGGAALADVPFKCIYEAKCVPLDSDLYPPEAPEPLPAAAGGASSGGGGSGSTAGAADPAKAGGAGGGKKAETSAAAGGGGGGGGGGKYVPPGMRGRGGAGGPAATSVGGGLAAAGRIGGRGSRGTRTGGGGGGIVGAEFIKPAGADPASRAPGSRKRKNKRARARDKAKKEADGDSVH